MRIPAAHCRTILVTKASVRAQECPPRHGGDLQEGRAGNVRGLGCSTVVLNPGSRQSSRKESPDGERHRDQLRNREFASFRSRPFESATIPQAPRNSPVSSARSFLTENSPPLWCVSEAFARLFSRKSGRRVRAEGQPPLGGFCRKTSGDVQHAPLRLGEIAPPIAHRVEKAWIDRHGRSSRPPLKRDSGFRRRTTR